MVRRGTRGCLFVACLVGSAGCDDAASGGQALGRGDASVDAGVDVGADAIPPDAGPPKPCVACHAHLLDSGSHRLHSGGAPLAYGDLSVQQPGGVGYAFGCGHCHPLAEPHHPDGALQIRLYDPAAPATSLKALHPATARYEAGTCSDTYCHSGLATRTGEVPAPGLDFPVDAYPVDYPPYEVERWRRYVDAVWGATPTDCGACHGFPPQARYPEAQAAAGESHAYLNPDGVEDMHVFNHGYAPIPCRTCHIDTVLEAGDWSRDAKDVTTLADVPIAAFDKHVNGLVEVAFDPVHPVPYEQNMRLDRATWDPQTRSCGEVSCHLLEPAVRFGAPYRIENPWECNACHRF